MKILSVEYAPPESPTPCPISKKIVFEIEQGAAGPVIAIRTLWLIVPNLSPWNLQQRLRRPEECLGTGAQVVALTFVRSQPVDRHYAQNHGRRERSDKQNDCFSVELGCVGTPVPLRQLTIAVKYFKFSGLELNLGINSYTMVNRLYNSEIES